MSETDAGDEGLLTDCVDCLAPAEAFAVVGNETRLAILEALWRSPERPVTFSDLRRRVGMRDSAQFNYHLGKLTGQFVAKTEDGYEFRHAGEKVVRAVLSGSFNENPTVEPFEVPGECADCGGTLTASYLDEHISVGCRDCGRLHAHAPFPPGGLTDRSDEEVAHAFDQRVRHLHCLAADGVCPECGGRMGTTLSEETGPLDVAACSVHRCEQCDHRIRSPVGLSLLDQSDVVGFHATHGVDLRESPHWTFEWCVGDRTTVLDDDPWRVRVDIPLDDEELRVTLDDELTAVAVERRRLG
jgi:DNA-binding transcriptional ArsR family regulator